MRMKHPQGAAAWWMFLGGVLYSESTKLIYIPIYGSMPDVVEHTDVVCPPKRTLAEQAEEGRVLPPVNFFRLSEARLRNSPVFRQISARPLAKRGVRVVGTLQHLTKSPICVRALRSG